ncbi:MAG: flagellar biosynthesis repressor FlbT [Rhodomicrobiaceae bacterium]|jgi:flagellar protein FlbT|nr:MAG: putative flagellum biosynthesis repressor protein FlbT 1 [Methyloligella sp.]
MALKVELKPNERLIIGDAVITNDDSRTRLYIEGSSPILREKDIIRPNEADTPCKKIYVILQLMYLSKTPRDHHDSYFESVTEVQNAAPSTASHFDAINSEILADNYYKALKEAQKLIAYEEELVSNAQSPECV